jgi:hypothetical protein
MDALHARNKPDFHIPFPLRDNCYYYPDDFFPKVLVFQVVYKDPGSIG